MGSPTAVRAVDPLFSDQTVPAGVLGVQDLPAYEYTGGGTVGDFNNDGYVDIFWLSGGGNDQPDKLWINNTDGTFTDQASLWGVNLVHQGYAATTGDFNDDGYLDMFVSSRGADDTTAGQAATHLLYRNNGNNTFTDIAQAAGVAYAGDETQWGAVFGDYDLDGDLDLFVTGLDNDSSRLFRNEGAESFVDVTGISGHEGNHLFSGISYTYGLSPRFVDMDGDLYPELLLVADFGTTRLFRNNKDGTFTDIATAAQTNQDENGMGSAVGDFNNDGLFDWYVTSVWYPQVGWSGNKLYVNQGDHQYAQIAEQAGCADGGFGWAPVAVDVNHDGWEDIVETNGMEYIPEFLNEQTYLWVNNGDLSFTEMAIPCGLIHTLQGRGMSRLDYDNDGDQDLAIFAHGQPFSLFRNDLPHNTETHWLRVILDTANNTDLAPHGIGAVVTVRAGTHRQHRYMENGANFCSNNELTVHFGLGEADRVDELTIRWPDGSSHVRYDVPANQTLVVHALAEGTVPPAPAADDRFNVHGERRVCDSDADCRADIAGPSPESYCREHPDGRSYCYVARQRYLSIKLDDAQGPAPYAMRVSLDTEVGGHVPLGFVSEPDGVAGRGPDLAAYHRSRIEQVPYLADWSRLRSYLAIGDCEVSPGHIYVIESTSDFTNYSAPTYLPTSTVPGDVTGGGEIGHPPNGVASMVDLMAILRGFQGKQNVPLDWLDVSPHTRDAAPDLSIDLSDAYNALQFMRQPSYPGLAPSECP
ncbi:MAG: CRTAC1 family protein [Planctomycetota bacterium]|jgi:hypothetical protein